MPLLAGFPRSVASFFTLSSEARYHWSAMNFTNQRKKPDHDFLILLSATPPKYSTFAIKWNSIFEGKCCKFLIKFPFYRKFIYTKRCLKNHVSALKSDKFPFFTNLRFCNFLMKFPFYRISILSGVYCNCSFFSKKLLIFPGDFVKFTLLWLTLWVRSRRAGSSVGDADR